MYVKKITFMTGCLLLLSHLVAANQLVRYNISEQYPDPKQAYYIDLLALALEETKQEYGGYFMQPIPVEMSQGRTSIMVELDHGIDVTWRMTSADSENRMLAVYFPLLKGLMGNRIFIIRKGEQSRFPKDITFSALTDMIAGQGHDWPDNEILHHNEVKVTTGTGHTLLTMLTKGRFDYFPRALHEPWIEIKEKPNYVVESNLMFQYPAPLYFFVNKENTHLRDRITLGLNKALINGKFETFFNEHPITRDILSSADIANRKVFYFENPLLTPETKSIIADKRLWLNKVE